MYRPRALSWPDCYNVRDLGGIVLPFGGRTRFGEIVRADSLDRLTVAGWQTAMAYGARTVLDLRSPSELLRAEGELRPSRIETVQAPILDDADTDTTLELARAESTEEAYCILLRRCAARFGAALRIIAHADKGLVIHCQAGRDRTGIVAALVLAIAGATPSVIAEDYRLTEGQLRPLYDQLLAVTRSPDQRALLEREACTSEQSMLGLLAYLSSHYGGVEPYVASVGLTQDEVERIRWRLVG